MRPSLAVAAALAALAAQSCLTPKAAEAPDASYAGGDIAPAPAGSDVDRVGQFILGKVAGRSIEQIVEDAKDDKDRLGILHKPLLNAAGVSSFGRFDRSLANGQFSIDPVFGLPPYGDDDARGFDQTDPRTPPALMFAFKRAGVCYGGYVAGYPAPYKVFVVDMHGKPCDAATVQSEIEAAYLKAVGAANQ